MNTVLFDLDGTLLPIDEEIFTKIYFKELARKLQPDGFDPEQLIAAVWAGTKRMVRNDGSRRNDEVFWAEFTRIFGCNEAPVRAKCDEFYVTEFERVRKVVQDAPHSAAIVRGLREKGYRLALATNPVFPAVAVRTRLNWIGLTPDDFAYITTYENSRFCKPNLGYYLDILSAIGAEPGDCLMVGNNVQEDMCFEALGGRVYLVTDHLMNAKGEDCSRYPQGDMAAFARYADGLEPL